MNSFNRKALTVAVLAGLGGLATTAEAVYRNPDGTGMVLIYPYYTVQTAGAAAGGGSSYNTYISVTNTTSVAKVTKVRFREGRTSAEVLDFNLYLSPNDVWVGAVGPYNGSTAADAPAAIFGNFETSCTHPEIPATGEPFKNTAYVAGTDALPGTGLDRTREGYVEIFDMATLTGVAATNVTHTGIGVRPPNCTAMRTNLAADATFAPLLASPTGGLYGEGTIINVNNGASMGYKADALDAYRSGQYYFDVASVQPQLGAQAAPFSLVLANNRAVTDQWTVGRNAVAAVFMHSSVMNDYVLESGPRSNTDWVMTFPGKHEFYNVGANTVTPVAPYTAILTTAGACEAALFTFFDRDEQNSVPPPGGFSPQSGGVGGPTASSLCWESTVISLRNSFAHTTASDVSSTANVSGVLGSRNVRAVSQVTPSFASGWLNVAFTGANAVAGITAATGGDMTAANLNIVGLPPAFGPLGTGTGVFTPRVPGHTFTGLPVTGFMVTTRANSGISCTLPSGSAGTCSGNYPALFMHSYRTTITP